MQIAILALQGAFAEHQQMLQSLGVDSVLIRNLNDWQEYLYTSSKNKEGHGGALIIPGGESTSMMKIMQDENLLAPIRDAINCGLPVFGTCAGMILLDDHHLGCMDITARRNAYGRQLGSFQTMGDFKYITDTDSPTQNGESEGVIMTFIRAPYIERAGKDVDILSIVDGKMVAARQGNMIVTAFHPELNDDTRIHEYFLSMI